MTLTYRRRYITVIAAALILAPTAAHATGSHGHDPVAICHKGQTITVDDSALKGHVKHGDTVGACVVVTVPTPVPEPTTEPTPEPTEEPTWEPTAPPTATPSPEPVNPEPKPSDEPTHETPGTPTEHGSEASLPTSPASTPPTPSSPPTSASPSSRTQTTPTPRPELAETGFNRGLLALGASMVAMGVLTVMGTRQWQRRGRK